MASRKTSDPEEPVRRSRPATTPEGRENQLIAAAFNLAEKQILEGTASSQVITHFLKEGMLRAQLEKEKLYRENQLLEKKAEQIDQQGDIKELYDDAIKAMREYGGHVEIVYDEED